MKDGKRKILEGWTGPVLYIGRESNKMNEIKGYSKLSKPAKKLFNEVYLRQQAALGRNEKLNYAPVKVIERKSYIEVHFSNGEFSKYFQDGTWG